MKSKGILKLQAGAKERKVNYIIKENKVLIITSGNSKKVNDIREDNKVNLVFSAQEEMKATGKILDNKDVVEAVFEEFNRVENNHFKNLKDEFVVIEFSI